jgi:ketosteroid isomerase-like protein
MASPNVELARSIFAAWERGEYRFTGWEDDEIEWVRPDGPEPGRWSGLDEIAEGWRSWLAAWDEFRIEPEACRELDSERVLVLAIYKGRGRSSGLDIGQITAKGAGVFRIRDGKVTHLITYWDRERALAELGLAGEGRR